MRDDAGRETQSALIDVVRGVAALQVVISHSVTMDMIFWGAGFGAVTGVYLFFILSGFLIWSSAKRVLPTQGGLYVYVVHRASRIMPLYYLSIFAAVTLVPLVAHFPQEITAGTIVRHIFFTQTLLPLVYRDINPVLWTLSLEAVFYVLIPLLYLIGKRHFSLIAVGTVVMFAIPRFFPDTTFSYFFSFFYLFTIGMILAQYQALISWPLALVAVIGSAVVWAAGMDYRIICSVVSTALFLCILLSRRMEHSRPFRAFAFLGTVSYSVYVWHYLVIDAIATPLVPYVTGRWPRAVILVAVSVAVGWVSYRLIEKPGQAALRRLLLPRRNFDSIADLRSKPTT